MINERGVWVKGEFWEDLRTEAEAGSLRGWVTSHAIGLVAELTL